jgi:hypothetical protein
MRMGKLGANALSLGALAVVSAASVGGSGCSTTNPTELVPGIMSQVVVPHDLQAVRVTVQANGKTEFDQGYDVGTNGAVQLPSTLGVVSGTSAGTVVTITVRGYETPCEESDDCNELGDMPVGTGGARILRRSIQTFVDQHTLFVPMPLSYSCWNTDCGDESMGCKGNTCTTAETLLSTLVDFDPSLIDGTDLCFSPAACFGDMPDGGKNAAVAPLVVDAAACKYAFPGPASESLNVRVYFQSFAWTQDAGGQYEPTLSSGAEQEILDEDKDEGFVLVPATEAGASSQTVFQLAPGLCNLVHAASNPPAAPPSGAATYITISDLRVANLCPPKSPLLPICAGERTNGPALPTGEATDTQLTCNVGVPLVSTESALYVVMDHSVVMHAAFGAMGSATALSLSLNDPVFTRTFAAFKFLPGEPAECTSPATSFTMPDVDFGLAQTVQGQIAAKLNGWTMTDSESNPSPLDLQAAMRLDAGAYAQLNDFLKGKESPNVAAAMFFVNRAPDATNDCSPPLDGQGSVVQAIESEITAAYDGTPSLQTYFVVLDDDAHDSSSPAGALTFFNKVRADLPQEVQVLDATQTSTTQAAQTAAGNFAKLVTQLATCVYDYALPAGADPSQLEVTFSVPGRGQAVVPASSSCSAATQSEVDGWSLESGRLRICGNSCSDLRQAILAAAATALESNQPAQDIPVTATILCDGNGPVNDAGAIVEASTVSDAGPTTFEDGSGSAGDAGSSAGSDAETEDGGSPVAPDSGVVSLEDASIGLPNVDGSIARVNPLP